MTLTHQTLHVRALHVNARIGVHDHEQAAPQPLLIDISAEVPGAADAERLADTLDYDRLAQAARDLAASPDHILLAETFAARLLAAVLALPGVTAARVRVDKPGALNDASAAGVELAGARTA